VAATGLIAGALGYYLIRRRLDRAPNGGRDQQTFAAIFNEMPNPVAAVDDAGCLAQPAPTSAGIDLASFRRNMREAGAEDAVEGIFAMFVQDVPERVAALSAAMTLADLGAIAKAAHAFKSPSAAIGATGLAGLLQEIELAGNEGAMDRASEGYARLPPEVEAVLRELRNQSEGGLDAGDSCPIALA
jgi:HPt (histidine-containing phosphotransfer) domain-containing protein